MKTARKATLILGCLFILSPLLLYWFIHGDYDRYMWIINGPYPFSDFGSGPVQIWMDFVLVLIGVVLVGWSVVRREKVQ